MMTYPLMRAKMLVVVRTDDHKKFSLQGTVNPAVVKGNHYHEIFLKTHFPKGQAVYYNSTEDCLNAVAAGKADCYVISMYRFPRIADRCEKLKLTYLSTGEDMVLSFALRRGEDKLYSVLNKIIGMIPESAVYAALASYSF